MERVFTIEGMHCASCVKGIEKAVKKAGANIKVNYGSKKAQLEYDEKKIKFEKIRETIEKTRL